MEVMEGANSDIINYFSKFEKNVNYDKYLRDLTELSAFRLRGQIPLGNLMVPDVGPSLELISFPDKIRDWEEMDIFELKNIIKLYDSGEIESIEEAVLLIAILKRSSENYPKILDVITEDIQRGKIEDPENYNQLLELDNGDCNSIIYGSLWKFLISMAYQ
jgi:hypothetical protein